MADHQQILKDILLDAAAADEMMREKDTPANTKMYGIGIFLTKLKQHLVRAGVTD